MPTIAAHPCVTKGEAIKAGCELNLLHRKSYLILDNEHGLQEVVSQNVVLMLQTPPMESLGKLVAYASTSTLSPFPDIGIRTKQGTMLTYGSGKLVTTGHKTISDSIMNNTSLIHIFSKTLQVPTYIKSAKMINFVVSGFFPFPLNRSKLRETPKARFTHNFVGTALQGDNTQKPIRVSIFDSGRLFVPGAGSLEKAAEAINYNLDFIQKCRIKEMDTMTLDKKSPRNTTRKRKRIGDQIQTNDGFVRGKSWTKNSILSKKKK